MKRKIENLIYAYDPQEFMPVRRDGQLENKVEFVAYKLRTLVLKKLMV